MQTEMIADLFQLMRHGCLRVEDNLVSIRDGYLREDRRRNL